MLNEKMIERTIEALRKEGPLRGGFNMRTWVNGCGTAGCMAGTVCLLNGVDKEAMLADMSNAAVAVPGMIDSKARTILGLKDPRIANHLFLPEYWVNSLLSDWLPMQLQKLPHNARPDLSTVEDMKKFAGMFRGTGLLIDCIGPDHAANCLEQILDNPYYVNWHTACTRDQEFLDMAKGKIAKKIKEIDVFWKR
jgi:hypothetical protein